MDDIAVAAWNNPAGDLNQTGYALATYESHLLVGAPALSNSSHAAAFPAVYALQMPLLGQTGEWRADDFSDVFGYDVAVQDVDADGVPEVAVGVPNAKTATQHGAAYVFSGLPSGLQDATSSAELIFYADERGGGGVSFQPTGPNGQVELLVQAGTLGSTASGAGLFAVNPTSTGILDQTQARVITASSPNFGDWFAAWDADMDGVTDILISEDAAVGWYLGPWTGAVDASDADGHWTARDPEDQLGERMRAVGDLTGDGADDLVLSAPTHGKPKYRAGRAYVVPAGGLVDGPAADIAIQIRGVQQGDGMGFGIAGGDIDGDGQEDLVLGAPGVYPGRGPGVVLVYLGPIGPGTMEPGDADAEVWGQHDLDGLGRAIEATDFDGDGREDLVLGAPYWPMGDGEGRIYLLSAADLLP